METLAVIHTVNRKLSTSFFISKVISCLTYEFSYTDQYLSTTPGDTAYFGDLSFVIHYANSTRIACANFTLVTSDNNTSGTNGTNGTMPTSTYSIPAPTSTVLTGGAIANSFSLGAGLIAFAALLL